MSRIEEARAVERARIILACLEGKEIPASGAGVECLHPYCYQVAQTLRSVGCERTERLAAAGQAGYVRRRLSQPDTGPAGATAAFWHVALGRTGSLSHG